MDKDTAITEQIDLTERKERIDMAIKELKEQDRLTFFKLPYDMDKSIKNYCLNLLNQERQDTDIILEETTLWLDTCYENEREEQEQMRKERINV